MKLCICFGICLSSKWFHLRLTFFLCSNLGLIIAQQSSIHINCFMAGGMTHLVPSYLKNAYCGEGLGETPSALRCLSYLINSFLRQWPPTPVLLPGKIPWMEEPGRLQSMGSLRVGYDWRSSLSLFTFMHWRRKWQPTPVFLPGESQGAGNLVGCLLWGRTESDTTEVT